MAAYTTVDRLLAALPLEVDDQQTREALGTLAEGVSGELDALLKFTFSIDSGIEVALDGSGEPKLWLPAPGAVMVLEVTENGTVLGATDYEHEPIKGRYLLRLDAAGHVSYWNATQQRGVVVTYVPNPAPAGLQAICYDECLRRWHARPGGSQDVAGVQGANRRSVPRGFTDHTLAVVFAIRGEYGVRNMVTF